MASYEVIKDDSKAKGLKEAKGKLDELKMGELEKIEVQRTLEEVRYEASMMNSSYGIGIIEGREEGRLEEKKAIAMNLLDLLDTETIAQKTGLTPADKERSVSSKAKNESSF